MISDDSRATGTTPGGFSGLKKEKFGVAEAGSGAVASHRMDPDGWLAADRGLETSATRRWASQNPRLYEAGAESYPERLTGFAE